MPEIGTYVALGDSFTEGAGDPYPDGTPRGWADLFAAELAMGTAAAARRLYRGRLGAETAGSAAAVT